MFGLRYNHWDINKHSFKLGILKLSNSECHYVRLVRRIHDELKVLRKTWWKTPPEKINPVLPNKNDQLFSEFKLIFIPVSSFVSYFLSEEVCSLSHSQLLTRSVYLTESTLYM